jgi:hypothetical protein
MANLKSRLLGLVQGFFKLALTEEDCSSCEPELEDLVLSRRASKENRQSLSNIIVAKGKA